jgi:ferredoxin
MLAGITRVIVLVAVLAATATEAFSSGGRWAVATPRLTETSEARWFPRLSPLAAVPLELEGQLDSTKTWKVKFVFNGETKEVDVQEGLSALEVGEKIFKGVESSCLNGVCTTCAGKVSAGRENVKLAVHGLGKPQIDAGYVCTCQCYVCGPGVTVELGKYDEVYESQYGQYEDSYEMKFGDKKEGAQKNKLFGI